MNGWRGISGVLGLIVLLAPQGVVAQAPAISRTSPQGVVPGASTTLVLQGANLANPTQVWTSFKCDAIGLTPNVPNNGREAGQVSYDLKVPANAPPGLHGLRVVTARGVSPLTLLFVDDLKSVGQVRPNNHPDKAQLLSLPCAVDGVQENLTRGYYKFSATAGQRLTIEVWARRFGSPLDPFIKLMNSQGKELAYSDDTPGLGGDCQLAHTFEAAGTYLLEIRDIRFQGGDPFKYRLRIGNFPMVTVPYPLSIPPGVPSAVAFSGKDASAVVPANYQVDAKETPRWLNVGAKFPNGSGSGFTTLGVSQGKEVLEQEPNDDLPQANRVALGEHLNGRFEKPADTDRFVFAAKKGETCRFRAVTRQQGSPADLNLRLLKGDGTQVAASEDANPAEDARFTYTFSEDANYCLLVTDLHGRSGPEYAYRVEVVRQPVSVELALSSDVVNLPQEGVGLVTITAKRNGFAGPIPLQLQNAPEGIVLTNPVIPAGVETAVLTLLNTGGVSQGQVIPLRIVSDLGQPATGGGVIAGVAQSLQTTYNNLPRVPGILSEEFALGISPRPPFVLRSSADRVVLGRGMSGSLRVKALRTAEFNDAITLEVTPKDKGLPAGVTVALKPIEKDQNSVELVVTGSDKAANGTYTAVIQGTGKVGNETVVQPLATIQLVLNDAFAATVGPAGGKLKAGGDLKVPLKLQRNPAFSQPVTVTVTNLPKGVTAPPLTIPAGASEGTLVLTGAKDLAKGNLPVLKVKTEGTASNVKHEKLLDLAVTVE